MNRIFVTVVDILGVLVPGAVFLAACLVMPLPHAPVVAFRT
jgi:hypothetical protein